MFPEAVAAPHQIFPQARLALVHARRSAASQRRRLQRHVDTLLIQGVARLMQGAEQRFTQIIFLGAGGNAHVAQREFGHERMVRFVLAAPVGVVAIILGNLPTKSQLLIFRVGSVQAAIVCRFLRCNSLYQRHQLFAQIGKNGAHALCFHALIRKINQRIGDMIVAGEAVGNLAGVVEGFFEIRPYLGKIISRASLRPHLVGRGGVFGQCANQLSRNLDRLIVLAASDPNQAGFFAVIGQRFGPRFQLVQQFTNLFVDKFLMGQPPNDGLLATSCCGSTGRHVGALVPVQQGVDRVQIINFL